VIALVGLAFLFAVPPASADQLFCDDVIIECGSLCVGLDCVNGESFGFDTIRLKENNLRIKFQDTSSSASFPSNDWQLTANDSTNGGANKFSIDDIDGGRTPFTIEAGARSNALYVEADGDIGVGTSNPAVDVEIVTGNTPTLRLQQDGSSGFTPQTWDVAGNETNFFIRDATHGSTLPFRIEPGAPSNVLYVEDDGDVGIGTTSPDFRLEIENGNLAITRTDTTSANIRFTTDVRSWLFLNNRNQGGRFEVKEVGGFTPFKIEEGSVANLLTLDGNEVLVGGTAVHSADYVFEPGYELESIEEHADYMWQNRHLPAVGPGTYDKEGRAGLKLGSQTSGMLEELEKAHIYIQQLSEELGKRGSELETLKAQFAELKNQLSQLR
jgi:hypothetical protein